MSASLHKMEALYSKLYSKYAKLKKEKDTSMENLNREQEEKFVNYVTDIGEIEHDLAPWMCEYQKFEINSLVCQNVNPLKLPLEAADEMIEYLRSEMDRLHKQVNELRSEVASMRSAKDEEKIQYQKLLMEENLQNKELRDEIQRLQQLDQEGACFSASNDKGKSRQIITVGDSLPDALDDSTITNKKHCRQSLLIVHDTHTLSPMEELPNRPEQPSTSSYRYTEPACCRRNVHISGDGTADISPALCIFQDLVQWLVGMKFSTVMENEELCMSALHESSGLSFSLTLTKNAATEPELVYRVLSLGTFERVAPEWMRDTIMFSPNMCPLFFQRVSRVIKLSY